MGYSSFGIWGGEDALSLMRVLGGDGFALWVIFIYNRIKILAFAIRNNSLIDVLLDVPYEWKMKNRYSRSREKRDNQVRPPSLDFR
jgi:hypothetical protein